MSGSYSVPDQKQYLRPDLLPIQAAALQSQLEETLQRFDDVKV